MLPLLWECQWKVTSVSDVNHVGDHWGIGWICCGIPSQILRFYKNNKQIKKMYTDILWKNQRWKAGQWPLSHHDMGKGPSLNNPLSFLSLFIDICCCAPLLICCHSPSCAHTVREEIHKVNPPIQTQGVCLQAQTRTEHCEGKSSFAQKPLDSWARPRSDSLALRQAPVPHIVRNSGI